MMVSRPYTVKIAVHVSPGAKRSAVTALKDGVWQVRIAASPVEGKANHKLVNYLSKELDVSRSSISILRGASGRNKLLAVTGLNCDEVAARLSAALPE
jgi:uncharacterized protein (TIGR00251 family)